MFRNLILTIVIAFLLLAPQRSQAGVWIHSGVMALFTEQTVSGSTTKQRPLIWTPAIGYRFMQGLFLGVQGLNTHALHDSDRSWGLGPKAGFLYGGLEFTGSFLPWVWDYSGSGLRKGSGFLIELGYSWSIFGPVGLGVSGLYTVTTLSTQNDQDLVQRPRFSTVTPQVTISLEF